MEEEKFIELEEICLDILRIAMENSENEHLFNDILNVWNRLDEFIWSKITFDTNNNIV